MGRIASALVVLTNQIDNLEADNLNLRNNEENTIHLKDQIGELNNKVAKLEAELVKEDKNYLVGEIDRLRKIITIQEDKLENIKNILEVEVD